MQRTDGGRFWGDNGDVNSWIAYLGVIKKERSAFVEMPTGLSPSKERKVPYYSPNFLLYR